MPRPESVSYKMKVRFWRRKNRGNDQGAAPLYMRITISKARAEIDTGRSATAKEWDAKAQAMRGNSDTAVQITNYLASKRVQAWAHYHALENDPGALLTAARVKELLSRPETPAPLTLLDLSESWHQHCAAPAQKAGKNTVRSFGTRRNELLNWLVVSKQKGLLAAQVRPRHAHHYEQYLLTRGNDPVTVRRYVAWLRQALAYGVLYDHLLHNPLSDYKCAPGAAKPLPVYLTEAEVEKLWGAQFTNTSVAQAVDAWLFCRETGLSWADYRNFNAVQHLHLDEGGIYWVRMVRQKMTRRKPEGFSVPLTARAHQLLLRYRNHLPAVGGTSGNKSFLLVQQQLGLSVHLTWKVARSTFAQYWTDKGVAPDAVAAMMGDTKAVLLRNYARVREVSILAALGPLLSRPIVGPHLAA